jgi:hypothetical protein
MYVFLSITLNEMGRKKDPRYIRIRGITGEPYYFQFFPNALFLFLHPSRVHLLKKPAAETANYR